MVSFFSAHTFAQHAAVIGHTLNGVACDPQATRQRGRGNEAEWSWELVATKTCAYCGSFVDVGVLYAAVLWHDVDCRVLLPSHALNCYDALSAGKELFSARLLL